MLDQKSKQIFVSETQDPAEQRFTGAHEVGHVRLHPDMERVHRDRPVRAGDRRPLREQQADEFAAAYLMPKKWVIRHFEDRFGEVPIKLDDHMAWRLDPNDPDRLLEVSADNLIAERQMAICMNAGNGHFDSLKDIYGVTATAMAIRLKELGVIDRSGVLTGASIE